MACDDYMWRAHGDRLLLAKTIANCKQGDSFTLNAMKAKIRYTAEPLGKLRVVSNFLPAPEDLVFRDEGIKVTLALSKRSVEFFKREAARHNTQYQRMIRRLLDAYAEHHEQSRGFRTTRSRLRRAGSAGR